MIVFQDVNFAYEPQKPVLTNLNLSIPSGECIGLIGANGAGKSSFMRVLLGLLPFDGHILIDGLEVCKKNLSEVHRRIGYVLQDSDNQMFMPTVLEDMLFGPLNYGESREEAEARVDQILAQLDISELKNRYNHKISGGEKRMAAIATILMLSPDIVLMDEPSSALDPCNRRKIIHTIAQLDMTRIIASHDLDLIYDLCSRVLLLSGGRIVADGPAEEILRNEQLLLDNHLELPLRFSCGV